MSQSLHSQKIINGIEVSVVKTDGLFKDPTPAVPYEIDEADDAERYVSYIAGRKSPILITAHQPTDQEFESAVRKPKGAISYFLSKRTIKEMYAFFFLIATVFLALWIKP